MPGKLVRAHGRKIPGTVAPAQAWFDLTKETILEPDLPIIDAHHHLFDRINCHYLFEEFLEDVQSGHNIRGSVFIDCGAMYSADGPPDFAPVGEVEFANGVAAMAASGDYGPARICAGIVGYADLTIGRAVGDVLDAQIAVGGGRFRGVRVMATWDEDEDLRKSTLMAPRGLLMDSDFRAGFATLGERKLSFDAWIFHPQLSELVDLARSFPDTTIILNHIGGLLAGTAAYAGRQDAALALWKRQMTELATCSNVFVKLGGRGMTHCGYGFHLQPAPVASTALAAAWHPVFETCIDLFGPERCMFESNFPPDKLSCSYAMLWNAFKRMSSAYSRDERHALFFGTAARAYRLSLT